MIRGFDRAKTKKQKNKKTTAKTGRCLLYFLSRNLPSMPIWCQEGRGRMTAAYVSECSPALMAPARPLKHIRILLCKCLIWTGYGLGKGEQEIVEERNKAKREVCAKNIESFANLTAEVLSVIDNSTCQSNYSSRWRLVKSAQNR